MPTKEHGAACLCPRNVQRVFLCACLLTLLVWMFYSISPTQRGNADTPVHPQEYLDNLTLSSVLPSHTTTTFPKIQRKRKIVVVWTSYFNERADWLSSTLNLKCPVGECNATSNRSMLSQSSAVVLHWRDVDVHNLPTCVPSETVHCPLWVLFNEESPPHTPRATLEQLQGKVHWMATYRRDSDIYAPYGKVLPTKERNSAKSDFDPGRRLVCWLVSNCNTQSKREVFVKELQKYTEVAIYGNCGIKKCPHRLAIHCYRWLAGKCKFYLSLENSICKDYITEKLFNALSSGMVPVVIGNASNYENLPPRSYIKASDFASPKELAEYLTIAGKDKDLYLSYFWWQRRYDVVDYSYKWLCDLCAKLHDTNIQNVKPRGNLTWWWYDQSGCKS